MAYRITTGPVAEPVSLSFVQKWLKLDGITADDEIVLLLLSAAREKVELHTGQALMTQTIQEVMDGWPERGLSFELALAPVASITSIEYRDNTDGTYQTWDASNYATDLVSQPARVWIAPNKSWPTLGAYPNAVRITYVAGYTSEALVPSNLRKAVAAQVCLDYYERMGYDIEPAKYLSSIEAATRQHRTIHA